MSLFLQRERQGFRMAGLWMGVLGAAAIIAMALAGALTADDVPISAAEKAQFEDAVSKFMAASHAPGISAAIVENGEMVWSEGFGMADLENSVPATSRTLYRLGSVSKPLTATAAMQLWERGKIELDAPVQKYCSAFPVKEWPITTRELLGHLGGIRHYKSDSQDDPEIGNTKHFESVADGIKFFANDPLVAKPGTKFNYSTMGYTLVGCAIEGASGENFAEYLHANIFIPAKMTDTQPDNLLAVIPLRTRYYSKNQAAAVVNADLLDSSYKIPGGGLISSADDMARFEIAILEDTLIKRATRDIMWTPQKAADGKHSGYALGWGTGTHEGIPEIGHNGSQQGASAAIILVPEKRDGVVVLVNMDEVGADELAAQLLKLALAAVPDSKN